MRKICLILMSSLLFTSCIKDELDPITDKNSSLKLGNIQFEGLNTGNSFTGNLNYKFLVESGTGNAFDTINYNSSFEFNNPLSSSQTFDFNTPDKTKFILFKLTFKIIGGGTAESMNVSTLFNKDGNTHFSKILNIDGELIRDSIFISPTQTITLP